MAPRSTANAYDIEMLRSERDAARADNARLTARVAELERENKSITVSFLSEYDRADDLASRETWYNSEIERLHAALDSQPATLMPRNCETCKRAAIDMQSKCSEIVFNYRCIVDDENQKRLCQIIYQEIDALPLLQFGAEQCADCEPLKPE